MMNERCLLGILLAFVVALLPVGCSRQAQQMRGSFDAQGLPLMDAGVNAQSPYRGWDHLVQRLSADGVSEEEISAVFKNEKMPLFSFVPFQLKPRESARLYSHFTLERNLRTASEFLKLHWAAFDESERLFGVSRFVVAAILLIETDCGKFTGDELVINRLSRVASVDEPNNLRANFERQLLQNPKLKLEEVQARAEVLVETFYPEVIALFDMKRRLGIEILQLKGSSAGAFGIPQFLPLSYLGYAVDGDKDNTADLFSAVDAIWSTAHYLKSHGWSDDAGLAQKRQVLWRYNRSEAYGDAVLKVSIRLRERERRSKVPPKGS